MIFLIDPNAVNPPTKCPKKGPIPLYGIGV